VFVLKGVFLKQKYLKILFNWDGKLAYFQSKKACSKTMVSGILKLFFNLLTTLLLVIRVAQPSVW